MDSLETSLKKVDVEINEVNEQIRELDQIAKGNGYNLNGFQMVRYNALVKEKEDLRKKEEDLRKEKEDLRQERLLLLQKSKS